MVSLESLLIFLVAAALLTVTPGPDILYVLTRGMAQGTNAAIAAAIGFASCILIHTTFAVIGLSALLQASATAFTIVKLLGAGYLIYLGLRALFDKSHFDMSGNLKPKQLKTIYLQSLIAGTLNPKLTIFFLAFLPQFVDQSAGPIWTQLLELGVFFMFITMIIFISLGLCAAKIGSFLKQKPKATHTLRYISGATLCTLGIGVAIHDS
ncbi:LysE family translocator [Poriferisphaera sp. WC338]|uniref:LysE family translocator n=1 Tax=Poriferisphaera sp. WC338 TaxID=3425129 RepID=UPI003D813F87